MLEKRLFKKKIYQKIFTSILRSKHAAIEAVLQMLGEAATLKKKHVYCIYIYIYQHSAIEAVLQMLEKRPRIYIYIYIYTPPKKKPFCDRRSPPDAGEAAMHDSWARSIATNIYIYSKNKNIPAFCDRSSPPDAGGAARHDSWARSIAAEGISPCRFCVSFCTFALGKQSSK
jgi:hypothetical protein